MRTELKAAHEALLARYFAADRSGEWQERNVLNGLVDVMDHVVRIGSTHSSHYRAQKALPLLRGAMRVRSEAFNNFADSLGTDIASDDLGSTSIDDLTRLIETVEAEITTVMWSRAWGEPIYRAQAKALHASVSTLAEWAQLERDAASPDPEGLQ